MASGLLAANERMHSGLIRYESNDFLGLALFLWVPLLMASAWGFRLLWRGNRPAALSWFLWMTITFTSLQAFLIYSLYVTVFPNGFGYSGER
jgi:hypothetical protein